MPVAVVNQSASGAPAVLKKRASIDFGSIPAPYVKEVTVEFDGADSADGVCVSASQALAAGVILGAARVSAANVVAVTIGTTGGTTVTPNTVTVDIYVTKGDASV